MILACASFISSAVTLPIRAFASIVSRVVRNPKTKTFFLERSRSHLKNQLRLARNLIEQTSESQPRATFWIHISSAGELEQAIPVMRALHQKLSVQFFVTYFSPSAKSFLKNCTGVIGHVSLPAEDLEGYSLIITELNISRLILVRYDFWPTLIHTARKRNLPIAVLAATLGGARSILPKRLQTLSKLFWFKRADLLFLIDEKERTHLIERGLSPEDIIVAGDAKWERAHERARAQHLQTKETLLTSALAHLASHQDSRKRKTIVFGSPHEDETQILIWCLEDLTTPCLFVVAPAEVDESTLLAFEKGIDHVAAQTIRLSDLKQSLDCLLPIESDRHVVLILDCFGQLATAYGKADCAIVGGGFDGQLHNVLEPAAYPVLTLFGNRTTRAPEAQILLNHNAAVSFDQPKALFDFLRCWSSLKIEGRGRGSDCLEFEHILKNARTLFGSLPNTSEVICRAIAQRDKLEII